MKDEGCCCCGMKVGATIPFERNRPCGEHMDDDDDDEEVGVLH